MRGTRQREHHREGRSCTQSALDAQASAVPIENMLDQRETEACSSHRAALFHVDAIEALGQARQVLGSDTGSIVADRNFRFACVRCLTWSGFQLDVDALARRAIFER